MDAKSFRTALIKLLNKHSMENVSNTPDFILAGYVIKCLEAYDEAVRLRTDWYGQDTAEAAIKNTDTK